MTTVPVLRTPRLTLRGHRLDDFEPMCAVWGDPVVARFIGGHPLSAEDTWARLLRYAGHWPLLAYGYWAVELTESGAYIGDVGFADLHRDITPSLAGHPEAGWVLAASAHGLGLATEAMIAAHAWLDAAHGTPTTSCIIHADHERSIRVAVKLGYREFALSDYRGAPYRQFRRDPTATSSPQPGQST